MAMLIAIELMTLLFAINTLSSVGTLVGAEGLWSKAQKDALYSLKIRRQPRVHRSFIVAIGKVNAYTAEMLEVSGMPVPVGRTYRDSLEKLL